MKVLLINHFPLTGSGSGVYTATTGKFLKDMGIEVRIIMPEVTVNYEKIPGIKIHPVYFKNEEIIDNQLSFNFPCFTTHPKSNKTFLSLTDGELEQYIKAFNKTIEEEVNLFKPDIIHAQHLWILSALASSYGVPLITTIHGTDLIGYQDSDRFDFFVKEAAQNSKKLITISESNNKLVKQLFHEMIDKIVLLKNGYDKKVFFLSDENKEEILHKYGIDKMYDKVVLFVGKLTYIKGVDMLLNSAYTYKNKNVLTIIAGDGEEKENLISRKIELGLSDVVFIGNRSQEELQKLYNIAYVAVVPSRKEAFGFVAIEALACGTPVVGSDQGEMPNFINNSTGILFHANDQYELDNALNKIINNEIIYDKKEIVKYAEDNYAQENTINKLVQIYDTVLKNNN